MPKSFQAILREMALVRGALCSDELRARMLERLEGELHAAVPATPSKALFEGGQPDLAALPPGSKSR